MPIATRWNIANLNPHIHSDADPESTPHHHQHAARTTQAKPPSAGVLSIILRAVIMCVLTSLFFLCVTLATFLLIHVFLAGRQLRRRRRRRTPPRQNLNAFSHEDLSQLDEFEYRRSDRGGDELDMEPECVICLERFGDGAWYRILPGCGHVFHSNCIDAWLVKAAVCPICRANVRLNAAEATSSADQNLGIA